MNTVKLILVFISIQILTNTTLFAQKQKEFFRYDFEDYKFPILVRGNLSSGKLIVFVQGGPGETAIDFARADYPKWKKTLEKEVAIAYYDQRGLNLPKNKIDTSTINYNQYSKDLIAISKKLQEKYNTEIYWLGHSAGGNMVLHTLQNFSEESEFIEGAIAANTPITSDFSQERYQHYRPLYLKNLAQEMIAIGKDSTYWQTAYDWMVATDSISKIEDSRKWNSYVDSAFKGTKRKIGLGMVMNVIFGRPYNPFKYLNGKDNQKVSRLLWKERKGMPTFKCLPNIKKPLLLVTGRYDDIAPPEEYNKAHQLISSSQLVVIPNASHESFLDQAETFNKTILEFLGNSQTSR